MFFMESLLNYAHLCLLSTTFINVDIISPTYGILFMTNHITHIPTKTYGNDMTEHVLLTVHHNWTWHVMYDGKVISYRERKNGICTCMYIRNPSTANNFIHVGVYETQYFPNQIF